MALYPIAPRISDKYILLNSRRGERAVFNDPADPDWVGTLTAVEGLESAEVRESAEDLVEADGGYHGNFWYGRRPVVLTGMIHGHTTMAERDARIQKLRAASDLLRPDAQRGDGALIWEPIDIVKNLWPNPGAEFGVIGDAVNEFRPSNNTAGMAYSTSQAFAGTRSFQWSPAGTGLTVDFAPSLGSGAEVENWQVSGSNLLTYGGGPRPELTVYHYVKPGQSYTVSGRVRAATTARSAVAGIAWYDANMNLISNSLGSSVTTTVGSWVNPTLTMNAPSNAYRAFPFIRMLNMNTADGNYNFDQMLFSTTSAYFDGSTAGNYWLGGTGPNGSSGTGVPLYLPVRRQARLAIQGGWVKQFQIPLISQSAYIQSYHKNYVGSTAATNASVSVAVKGDTDVYPVIEISASAGTLNSVTQAAVAGFPGADVRTLNFSSLPTFGTSGLGNDKVIIDLKNRNMQGSGNFAQNLNQYINWTTSTWPRLVPDATTTFTISHTSATAKIAVYYRDAWA